MKPRLFDPVEPNPIGDDHREISTPKSPLFTNCDKESSSEDWPGIFNNNQTSYSPSTPNPIPELHTNTGHQMAEVENVSFERMEWGSAPVATVTHESAPVNGVDTVITEGLPAEMMLQEHLELYVEDLIAHRTKQREQELQRKELATQEPCQSSFNQIEATFPTFTNASAPFVPSEQPFGGSDFAHNHFITNDNHQEYGNERTPIVGGPHGTLDVGYKVLSSAKLVKFRTVKCLKKFNHVWKDCDFSHARNLRRDPSKNLYSPHLCSHFSYNQDALSQCSAGQNCHYCHSKEELNFHPLRYKTTQCRTALSKEACPREFCAYWHSESDKSAIRPELEKTLLLIFGFTSTDNAFFNEDKTLNTFAMNMPPISTIYEFLNHPANDAVRDWCLAVYDFQVSNQKRLPKKIRTEGDWLQGHPDQMEEYIEAMFIQLMRALWQPSSEISVPNMIGLTPSVPSPSQPATPLHSCSSTVPPLPSTWEDDLINSYYNPCSSQNSNMPPMTQHRRQESSESQISGVEDRTQTILNNNNNNLMNYNCPSPMVSNMPSPTFPSGLPPLNGGYNDNIMNGGAFGNDAHLGQQNITTEPNYDVAGSLLDKFIGGYCNNLGFNEDFVNKPFNKPFPSQGGHDANLNVSRNGSRSSSFINTDTSTDVQNKSSQNTNSWQHPTASSNLLHPNLLNGSVTQRSRRSSDAQSRGYYDDNAVPAPTVSTGHPHNPPVLPQLDLLGPLVGGLPNLSLGMNSILPPPSQPPPVNGTNQMNYHHLLNSHLNQPSPPQLPRVSSAREIADQLSLAGLAGGNVQRDQLLIQAGINSGYQSGVTAGYQAGLAAYQNQPQQFSPQLPGGMVFQQYAPLPSNSGANGPSTDARPVTQSAPLLSNVMTNNNNEPCNTSLLNNNYPNYTHPPQPSNQEVANLLDQLNAASLNINQMSPI